MNRFIFRILCLTILLLTVSSCVEPIHQSENGTDKDLYPISFRVCTQDDAALTKAGPISGKDVDVSKLFMYCFDQNGRFLGRFQATNLTSAFEDPIENQGEPDDNTQPAGTFKGQIPPATARIHFVGNANKPVGNDYVGMTEVEVMHDSNLVCSDVGDGMAYWGYLKKNTPEDMAGILSNGGTTVLMVRDRLWIEAGTHGDDIEDVYWVVYNGLKKAYIAPCHFKGSSIDSDNPYQPVLPDLSTIEVTPFGEVEGGRFTTTKDEMVPFEKTNPMYVFEDYCLPSTPSQVTKIIVKAKFINSGHTKYFPICITHRYDEESIPIKRGHKYLLNLQNLPEASGLGSFEAAAEADYFINGALANIPDDVIEVSDGKFDMKVNYILKYPLSQEEFASTAILLQKKPSSGIISVPFIVTAKTDFGTTFHFEESSWLTSISPAAIETTPVTWGAGITTTTSTGENPTTTSTADINKGSSSETLSSTVTMSINDVGATLKESVFNLKGFYTTPITEGGEDVKHVLMRNVSVYSINNFQIQSNAYTVSETGGNGYNSKGNLELMQVAGQTGVYQLKFMLPTGAANAYPDLLYPLQVKIASTTLQPYAIGTENETPSNAVFGVQVRTTAPNTEPAKLSTQTQTIKKWNYQAEDNLWNFWYSYSITSAPLNPEICIYLKDIRNSGGFSTDTRPVDVGLFLYIEFFGEAQSVSYTPQ